MKPTLQSISGNTAKGAKRVEWAIQIRNRVFCYGLMAQLGIDSKRALAKIFDAGTFRKINDGFDELRSRRWDYYLTGGTPSRQAAAQAEELVPRCTDVLRSPLWRLLCWRCPDIEEFNSIHKRLSRQTKKIIYDLPIDEISAEMISASFSVDQFVELMSLEPIKAITGLAFLIRIGEHTKKDDIRRTALALLEKKFVDFSTLPAVYPVWSELWACILLILQVRPLACTIRRGFSAEYLQRTIDANFAEKNRSIPAIAKNTADSRNADLWGAWLHARFSELDKKANISTAIFIGANFPVRMNSKS